MNKPPNPPAFPTKDFIVTSEEGNGYKTMSMRSDGMTLRDYLAGQALVGLLPRNDGILNIQDRARQAYEFADAMLSERNKNAE